MRKGLLVLAPFALVASLHMACSSSSRRSGFAAETLPDPDASIGTGPAFVSIDASTDVVGCSESKTEIARVPVVIEFVVDESGSMSSSGKWTAARDALKAAFTDMQATADGATFIGAYLFGSTSGKQVAPESLANASHFKQIVSLIDKSSPGGGGTPTEQALIAAYKIVETFKPAPSTGIVPDEMKRVVILMSDGSPNGGVPEQDRCELLAESKFNEQPPDGPILTFSVGIGPFPATSGYDPAFMGRLAQKGGTAPKDCSPTTTDPAGVCHYQVTPGEDVAVTKQALVDALNKIRAITASCEFSFTINQNTDLGNVEVVITDKNGDVKPISKDPTNGWSFDDPANPTKIILNGEACSQSNGTVSGRVDVTIGCRTAN